MKFIQGAFKLIAMALLVGGIFSGSGSSQTKPLAGSEAIKQLRESGGYESLRAAFTAARKQSTGESAQPEASQIKLIAADGAADDNFGRSIAISGDTAIVGADSDDIGANANQGSAYVFVRSGATWTQQAQLTASDGAANDAFGFSVAISGDTVIVGAFLDAVGANFNQGSAYVFVRNGTFWTQQQKLTAADGAASDLFGFSVAVSGNTVIVGANSDDIGANANQGSAYVFVRNGATWTQQQMLAASDGAANDNFGNSVAISGETAIVGADNDDIGANTNQGSAYVFVRSGVTWTQQVRLIAADGAANDLFGFSVGISGETAIVGANYHHVGANANQGSAYIFVRNGATWTQQQMLAASDGAANDYFGFKVGISGDTVIVGAYLDTVGANTQQGSAYIFTRNGTVWSQQIKLTAADSAAGDIFGSSVAISGATAIVGAYLDTVGTNSGQGSAYVFDLSRRPQFDFDGDGKSDVSVFRPSNGYWYLNNSSTGFTYSGFGINGDLIAPADYDGDGRTDLAVFRPSNGAWYLQRSTSGFTQIQFGAAGDLPMPADFDGDGKAEIAIFRPSTGVWFTYNLANGQTTSIAFGISGDTPTAADYDGDGKADIAVFRQSSGVWYLNRSTAGFTAIQFGANGDKAVPADYDGDGKTDLAVWRPSSGVWYLQQSTAGFTYSAFGLSGDLPAPADYDGDGKTDLGIFRPSNGAWYLQRTTAGFTQIQFGAAGDKPTPNAFVP